VEHVLGALGRWRTRSPRRQALQATVASWRAQRHRMREAHLRGQHLPLGAGGAVRRRPCPSPDSRRLSSEGPDGMMHPCRRCRQAPIEDRRSARPCLPTPVLPPRLSIAPRSRRWGGDCQRSSANGSGGGSVSFWSAS